MAARWHFARATSSIKMYVKAKAEKQQTFLGPRAFLISDYDYHYNRVCNKFSMVIGSPHAYLTRNRHAITWVPNFCYWMPNARDSHVNYALLLQCFVQSLSATDVFARKSYEICYIYD